MVEILYKYMPAERALTCLPEVGDGTLRATQPAALNDPFECGLKTDFIDIGWDEIKRNEEYAEVLNSIPGTGTVTADDVYLAKRRSGSLYLRDLFAAQLSQRFGIVSFSANPRHPLMWSHYTLDASGFVVGYETEKLWSLGSFDSSLFPVRYCIDVPEIGSYEVLHYDQGYLSGLMSFKSVHWSYEEEWRLIVELNQTIGTGLRDSRDLPVNLVRVPNEAVVSVYHTERTPPDTVDKIRSRLRNPNNRYGTTHLSMLIASAERYEYEDALESGI